MSDLAYRLRGISGSSCRHGEESYEACETHHAKAAYGIVRQFLTSPEVRAELVLAVGDFDWDDYGLDEMPVDQPDWQTALVQALTDVIAPHLP